MPWIRSLRLHGSADDLGAREATLALGMQPHSAEVAYITTMHSDVEGGCC